MRWYRDFQATAPEEFYVFLGLQTLPSGDPFPKEHWGKKICALLVSHNGTATEAEKAATPPVLRGSIERAASYLT